MFLGRDDRSAIFLFPELSARMAAAFLFLSFGRFALYGLALFRNPLQWDRPPPGDERHPRRGVYARFPFRRLLRVRRVDRLFHWGDHPRELHAFRSRIPFLLICSPSFGLALVRRERDGPPLFRLLLSDRSDFLWHLLFLPGHHLAGQSPLWEFFVSLPLPRSEFILVLARISNRFLLLGSFLDFDFLPE